MDAFKTACRLLTRFRLPSQGPVNELLLLSLFPVVGGVLGGAAWFLATCFLAIGRPPVGAVLGALVIPPFLWWATRARGMTSLMWLTDRLPTGDQDPHHQLYLRLSVVQGTVLVKLLCVGLILYFRQGFWVFLVPVLSCTALAEMRRRTVSEATGGGYVYHHWVVAAGLVLVVSGLAQTFVGGLFALVLAWLLIPLLNRLAEDLEPGATERNHWATAELVELTVLLLGVLYFLGR